MVLEKSFVLDAADGMPLGATLFEPQVEDGDSDARATLVVCSATAAPASYYAAFARHCAAAGLRVLTFDYRGIGRSRPARLRGFDASMSDWALLDARAALAHARREHGDAPILLVGHSFGGQLLGLLDDARDVAGAILVASQLGYFGHWPLLDRAKLGVLWSNLVPALTGSFGYLPGWAGLREDLPAGVAEEWARWCRHPDYLMGENPDARARFARFDRPLLLFSFSDDDLAPRPAVDALVSALSSAALHHRHLSPADAGADALGHFGFFRPRTGARLWADVIAYVDDVLDGRELQTLVTMDEIMQDLSYGR